MGSRPPTPARPVQRIAEHGDRAICAPGAGRLHADGSRASPRPGALSGWRPG